MRRRKDQLRIAAAYVLVCLLALGLVLDVARIAAPRAVPAVAPAGAGASGGTAGAAGKSVGHPWLRLDTATLKRMLRSVIPGLGAGDEPTGGAGAAGAFSTLLTVLTGAAPNDPKTFLSNQIPLLADVTLAEGQDEGESVAPAPPPAGAGGPADEEEQPAPETDQPTEPAIVSPSISEPKVIGKPLIAIYHTHARESYLPELRRYDKNATEAFSRNMNITTVAAGEELARVLSEKYGIGTAHSLVIHDAESRGGAYVESLKTAQNLLKQYPSIKMLIDLHRDSAPRSVTTAKISGLDTARILIVVGSNQRLKHPNWQRNYAFARTVAAEMERKYPGLLRGVSVHADRYNQHLSPGSLIFEIGGIENSLEEVKRADRLLADVIAELVKKNLLPQ